jgi:hypothetical protein
MGVFPILPNELWRQILSYVITPTHPVHVEGWEDSKPLLQFNPADTDVQRSLDFLTGPTANAFVFPISVPDIWQHFISRATWSLDRDGHEIREIVTEDWPHRHGKEIPWAKDLEMLEKSFTAQVKHVEVIANQYYYFPDGEMEDLDRLLPSPQWASAMTGHISAILETCSLLSSLRLYLDVEPGVAQFEDYYRSDAFEDIWRCTGPTRHYKQMVLWKAECRRRGVDFKIIARMSQPGEQDDLAEFWDLPGYIHYEQDINRADRYLTWAIEAHAARKKEGKIAKLRADAEDTNL